MAINRFYQPAQGQYISQFVPEELPTELMMGVLSNKQKVQDQGMREFAQFGDWYMDALPNADTEYVKQKQTELRDFFRQNREQEFASAAFQDKYQSLIRGINDDPYLAIVKSQWDTDQAHKEHVKKLKEKGAHAWADELDREYQAKYNEYVFGEGYKGQARLHDPYTREGVDELEEGKKYFSQVEADSNTISTYLNSGFDQIWYDVKNGGKSPTKLAKIADELFNVLVDTPLYEQWSAQHDQIYLKDKSKETALRTMSEEDKKTYAEEKKKYVMDKFHRIAQSFRSDIHDESRAAAMNAHRGESKAYPVIATSVTAIDGGPVQAYAEDSNEFNAAKEALNTAQSEMDQLIFAAKNVPGGQHLFNSDGSFNLQAINQNQDVLLKAIENAKVSGLINPQTALRLSSRVINPNGIADLSQTIAGAKNKMDEFNTKKLSATDNAIATLYGNDPHLSGMENGDASILIGEMNKALGDKNNVNHDPYSKSQKVFELVSENFTKGGIPIFENGKWTIRYDLSKPTDNFFQRLETAMNYNKNAIMARADLKTSSVMWTTLMKTYKTQAVLEANDHTTQSEYDSALNRIEVPDSDMSFIDTQKYYDTAFQNIASQYGKTLEQVRKDYNSPIRERRAGLNTIKNDEFDTKIGEDYDKGFTIDKALTFDTKQKVVKNGVTYQANADLFTFIKNSNLVRFEDSEGNDVRAKMDPSFFTNTDMGGQLDLRPNANGEIVIETKVLLKPIFSLKNAQNKPTSIKIVIPPERAASYRRERVNTVALEAHNIAKDDPHKALDLMTTATAGEYPADVTKGMKSISTLEPGKSTKLSIGDNQIIHVQRRPDGRYSANIVESTHNITENKNSGVDNTNTTSFTDFEVAYYYLDALKRKNRIQYNIMSQDDMTNRIIGR